MAKTPASAKKQRSISAFFTPQKPATTKLPSPPQSRPPEESTPVKRKLTQFSHTANGNLTAPPSPKRPRSNSSLSSSSSSKAPEKLLPKQLKTKLTPLEKQFVELKRAHPDKLHSSIHEVTKAGERNKKAIFKTALIARLYKSLAVGPWANECKHDYVLSVGVTGEIVVFNQVNKNSTEIEQIYEKLSEEGKIPSGSSMDALYEKLNRPFSYKLTGKALQGIYKPFFNLNASNDLIDYDLEDIERASTLGVLL